MGISKENFIKHFSKEIRAENSAIFAGAGLSIPAGLVNWKELIQPLADELGLDVAKEHDLIAIAQYHCNANGNNRGMINQTLIDEISNKGKITENHKILARLPIKTYWTTNYDKFIEKSLEDVGKIADVKYTIQHLAQTTPNRSATVYKMHGDIDHPDKAIVTKDDYEKYHVRMTPFINALAGDLISKTFLFLGFSFQDPNLDYILSRVRIALEGNQRRHYCILKKVDRQPTDTDEDYEYNKRKQKYFIDDLKRFNIRTVLIDDYNEIPEMLMNIERRLKQKSIFISSAISDYSQYSQKTVESLLRELSRRLIRDGYSIVTGYGLGVGNSIILGALEEIYMNNRGDKEQLEIKPFPQFEEASIDRATMWTQHRTNMLSNCGIAIFLFGNKFIKDKVVNSNGIREEFEIAKSLNAYLLPVGETGYMAKELFKETLKSYEEYNSNYNVEAKDSFKLLNENNADLTKTVDKVMSVLCLI